MVRCPFCSECFCLRTTWCMIATQMPDNFAVTCRSNIAATSLRLNAGLLVFFVVFEDHQLAQLTTSQQLRACELASMAHCYAPALTPIGSPGL